jgi:hypothetical protein
MQLQAEAIRRSVVAMLELKRREHKAKSDG